MFNFPANTPGVETATKKVGGRNFVTSPDLPLLFLMQKGRRNEERRPGIEAFAKLIIMPYTHYSCGLSKGGGGSLCLHHCTLMKNNEDMHYSVTHLPLYLPEMRVPTSDACTYQ